MWGPVPVLLELLTPPAWQEMFGGGCAVQQLSSCHELRMGSRAPPRSEAFAALKCADSRKR